MYPMQPNPDPVFQDPPLFHSYRFLEFMATMLLLLGILLILLGVAGLFFSLIIGVPMYFGSDIDRFVGSSILSFIGMIIRLSSIFASIVLLLAGFASIASSELIKVLVELQENADRQALLLRSIFYTLYSQGR